MIIAELFSFIEIMCKNTGHFIKLWAKIIGCVEISISVIGGIILLFVGFFNDDYYFDTAFLIIIGLVALTILPIVIIFKTLILHGFGEMVENSKNNSNNNAKKISEKNIAVTGVTSTNQQNTIITDVTNTNQQNGLSL